ncbi:hypothetical protein SERLA73DRAFT_74486 [Serpula lacrymans var. lacrymans S7.3]|uniref:Uncharacterized protein n=2 Tax=Serpula lacrymans var. lacrymans TaxID=341189 RepID=F8PZE0_SERL3|nr:hypothetical protein SERLA73DRAFT_74486 [Serpula lacrymans var. lacrymans S7.3]
MEFGREWEISAEELSVVNEDFDIEMAAYSGFEDNKEAEENEEEDSGEENKNMNDKDEEEDNISQGRIDDRMDEPGDKEYWLMDSDSTEDKQFKFDYGGLEEIGWK